MIPDKPRVSFQVACSMDIAVFDVTTAAARADSIFQHQALVDQTTLATKLA